MVLTLVACTPTRTEDEAEREAERAPEPPPAFDPSEPVTDPAGPATRPSFDADAPPMWFDDPICNSRYAHAKTLHLRLPDTVDVDVQRLGALREFSTHTLVWTPEAARHLVGAPAPGTRSRVRWRLMPGAPVELWIVDADPSPADAESCWDAVNIHGTVELESADGSLAITSPARVLQLTPTSTWVQLGGAAEDFGLASSPATNELDPRIELHVDLPVAAPRRSVPVRMDPRGLTPFEVQLAVTVDKTLDGRERKVRGVDFLAVSER